MPKPRIVTTIDEASADENRAESAKRRAWYREGRCPWCGELGDFVHGAPVCSIHGPYPFVPEPSPDVGFDEAETLPEEE